MRYILTCFADGATDQRRKPETADQAGAHQSLQDVSGCQVSKSMLTSRGLVPTVSLLDYTEVARLVKIRRVRTPLPSRISRTMA